MNNYVQLGNSGINYAAGSVNQDQLARTPEVLSQVVSLETNISRLADEIGGLQMRLEQSVLRGESPVTGGNEKQSRAVANTSLGSKLQEANDALVVLASRVHSLIDRLEV